MRVYLDSNALIHAHEAPTPLRDQVVLRMLTVVRAPGGQLLTSVLSRLECRVKPLRMNDVPLLAQYEAIFTSPNLMVIPLDSPIIERATELRVKYGFRTPDALHLATAIEQHATAFLTGDIQLSRCTEVDVELL